MFNTTQILIADYDWSSIGLKTKEIERKIFDVCIYFFLLFTKSFIKNQIIKKSVANFNPQIK